MGRLASIALARRLLATPLGAQRAAGALVDLAPAIGSPSRTRTLGAEDHVTVWQKIRWRTDPFGLKFRQPR